MEDGEKRERKNVRERLGWKGGIVFQQGRISIIKGKRRTLRMIPVKFPIEHYRY